MPAPDDGPTSRRATSGEEGVAALLARDRRGLPWHRIVPVLAAVLVVAGLGLAALSVLRRTPRGAAAASAPAEPAVAVEGATLLPPLAVRAEGDELTAAFSGFAVSVETDPPGAVVTVAGRRRGEAPVLADVPCAPGAPVDVVAELPGRPPARRATTCRADTLVKLTLRLPR
jgi:hypothetical protein